MWWSRKEASPPPSSEGPAALPVTRAEWRSVPPIQRVVAEHPLVNPVQRFSSSLTSWQCPAYLEPLGHRVGPEEPAGVIGDLARPRTLETPAPAMPVVQRATRKRSGLSRLWGASVQRSESAPEPAPALEEAAPVQLLPEESAPLPMPSLVLPAVASREVVRPLTSAAATLPASPPVRTVQAIREEPSVVDTPAAAEMPLVAPDPVVPVEAPEPAPAERSAVEPARPVLPVIQRTEQAAPRRLGLGAPILSDVGGVPKPAEIVPESPSADAPLAGAIETTVPAADDVPEPTQAADDAPLPVSRLADLPVETPTLGTPSAVQRSESPTPLPVPLPGPSVLKPVQRLRDESPPPSIPGMSVKGIGTPGEVTVSQVAESMPELPTVTSSRSSPVNTFRPLDGPEIRSGTTEPPGMPGGSTSVSPPPALPVARAVEDPVAPSTRALETPPLPIARAVEGSTPPAKPVARALDGSQPPATRPAEHSPAPELRAVESTTLPATRAAETLPLTVARAVETPALPVARAVEGSPLSVARAVEGSESLVARAVETPALPVARTLETPALPVARTLETPALPVARTLETPALPVARAVDSAVAPVARAVEAPALPVARTLDALAPTIPPLAAQPAVSTTAPVRHPETAPLPTLPVSRATETSVAPMTLPVARVLEPQAPTIQRTETASPDVMNGPFLTEFVRKGPFITSGASSAPMLTGSLPVAQREEGTAAPPPLPVARSIEGIDPRPPTRSAGSEPLPVARIADRSQPSTVDFLATAQRATNGSAPHSEALTLNLPPVVVSRQTEAPIVQREPEPPPPAPAPAPEAPPAPAAPAPAAAQPETDELVKKLFDPLLRRLKTELRLDRERRGALTDRPH